MACGSVQIHKNHLEKENINYLFEFYLKASEKICKFACSSCCFAGSSPCMYVACGSQVCGLGTISHLGEVNGSLFLGELHWEAFCTVREDVLHSSGALAEGMVVSLCFRGSETLRRFSGDRCHLAPASQGALVEHRGCSWLCTAGNFPLLFCWY